MIVVVLLDGICGKRHWCPSTFCWCDPVSSLLSLFILLDPFSKVQEFVVRNDCPCGSTIGPTISSLTGIRVVDAGMPQLSMHSVREVMGIADLQNGIDLFLSFFNNFRTLDDNMSKEIEGTTAYD